ncbi:MAG: S8 family peptidase [Micromonosporaceae bacterium]
MLTRARVGTALGLGVGAALAMGAVPGGPGRAPAARADTVRSAEQPVLRTLGLTRAWKASTGRGVTVGVLDSGVDGNVADLAGSVTTGPDYTRGANPAGFHPPRLHGTYIASIIAGHGNGPGHANGVIGVAPSAHVLAVRVLLEDSEPGFLRFNEEARFDDTVAMGIRYAVKHGAEVINMSLGEPRPTSDEEAAIGSAIAKGVVVVASAGNDGMIKRRFTPYSYPASVPGVISVAALTAAGKRAFFSDHNASVVVGAPGVGVVGAGPGGQYLVGDGTSQASAFVSGVAALIRAKYPALSPELVTRAIIESTKHRPRGGYNTDTGFGEVNAAGAMRSAALLARSRPAAGLSPSASVGGAAAKAPVKIIYHNGALITSWGAAGAVGGLGFLAALVVLAGAVRRTLRERARFAGVPGGGGGPARGAVPVDGAFPVSGALPVGGAVPGRGAVPGGGAVPWGGLVPEGDAVPEGRGWFGAGEMAGAEGMPGGDWGGPNGFPGPGGPVDAGALSGGDWRGSAGVPGAGGFTGPGGLHGADESVPGGSLGAGGGWHGTGGPLGGGAPGGGDHPDPDLPL